MTRRAIALLLVVSFCIFGCQGPKAQSSETKVFSEEGGEIARGKIRLEIPPDALKEKIEIRLEKRNRPAHPLSEGYSLVGDVVEIQPTGMVFSKPFRLTLSFQDNKVPKGLRKNLVSIAYHNGEGWVTVADSRVDTLTNTVSCSLYHSTELVVISREREYGMVEHPFEQGKMPLVLIHGATQVRWHGLRKFLRKNRYPSPIWMFEYPVSQGVVNSAEFLSDELAQLRKEYGDFKINIVGHDIGGLVGLYYALKDEIYHNDIEKALITIATPHKGTGMASHQAILGLVDRVAEFGGKLSPQDVDILFSFADALGSTGGELGEGSQLLEELQQLYKAHLKRFTDYSKEAIAVFRIECFAGDKVYPLSLDLASLIPDPPSELTPGEGDTYVSVRRTKLSPIENSPFHVSHWELLQDERVWQDILGYLELELLSWPRLFQDISSPEGRAKIVETWEKQFKLNQNDDRSFGFILDFGRNLLNSCGPNAILFTNGDNDTYPLWWVQQREGLRKDVAIVNLSLLNTAVFTKYLKGEPHHLPISLTEQEIESLKPAERKGKRVYVSQQVVDDLIETNGWERPIYYAVTCARDYLREPRRLEGLVYRLLPEAEGEGMEVDAETCRKNMYEIYSYQGLFNQKGEAVDGLDPDMEKLLCWDYSAIHFQIGQELNKRGDVEGAAGEFQQAIRFGPKRAYIRFMAGAQYEEMGKLEEAEAELKVAMELDKDYFPAGKSLASVYQKTGREVEGVRLLAKWLERHPEDNDAIEFLKEFTEGLPE